MRRAHRVLGPRPQPWVLVSRRTNGSGGNVPVVAPSDAGGIQVRLGHCLLVEVQRALGDRLGLSQNKLNHVVIDFATEEKSAPLHSPGTRRNVSPCPLFGAADSARPGFCPQAEAVCPRTGAPPGARKGATQDSCQKQPMTGGRRRAALRDKTLLLLYRVWMDDLGLHIKSFPTTCCPCPFARDSLGLSCMT